MNGTVDEIVQATAERKVWRKSINIILSSVARMLIVYSYKVHAPYQDIGLLKS